MNSLDTGIMSDPSGFLNAESPRHLHRLFVAGVPKSFVEKDILPLFSGFGDVKDIIVLREPGTQAHKGCAFVSYGTHEEALRAVESLDRKLTLPNALAPLQVRLAKNHHYVRAGSGPGDNKQLFFTGAPFHFAEKDISSFFGVFGAVEEVNLFRSRASGNSKGCGFVTFEERASALKAIQVLENRRAEPSQGISVQWADPDLQLKKKKALQDSNADNRTLFFAKAACNATDEDIKAVFSQFGHVCEVSLFRPSLGASISKGCGLVVMSSPAEARIALESLQGRYIWPGVDSPMVVTWMDVELQRRRREHHMASMRHILTTGPGNATGPAMHGSSLWPTSSSSLTVAPAGTATLPRVTTTSNPALSRVLSAAQQRELGEKPPAGCDTDAIKLFVGNIPRSCTEEQLQPFFETIGPVVELIIIRDKATQQSKGCAFVWYQQRLHAERAVLHFHLRHTIPEGDGSAARPLVVRKAREHVPAGPATPPGLHTAPGGFLLDDGCGYASNVTIAGNIQLQNNVSLPVLATRGSSGNQTMGPASVPMVIPANMAAQLGVQTSNNQSLAPAAYSTQLYTTQAPTHPTAATTSTTSGNAVIIQTPNGPAALTATPIDNLTYQTLFQPVMTSNGMIAFPRASIGGANHMGHAQVSSALQQQFPGAQIVSIHAAPGIAEAGLYGAYSVQTQQWQP